MKRLSAALSIALCLSSLYCGKEVNREGLVGIYFSEPNLTSIKAYSVLTSLEQVWGQDYEYGTESSGRWTGYLVGPVEGEVILHLSTNRRAKLILEGFVGLESESPQAEATLNVQMKEGERIPVELTFWNDNREGVFIPSTFSPRRIADSDAFFSVKWEWEGHPLSSIPASFLAHTAEQALPLSHITEPDPSTIDMTRFIRINGKHVQVYHEKGRYGGWPANNGIWNWGDEILVGFTRGYFRNKKHHHSYDKTKPGFLNFARSTDGGETWRIEEPDPGMIGNKPIRLRERINFAHPDLALRNDRERFNYSYDRGRTWKGPFGFPELNRGPLTSRTDYLPAGRGECLLFLSSKSDAVKATLQDKAFCALASDGGRKITFMGWMTEPDTIRAVMPATVRVSDSHLISAMRRRYDPPINDEYMLAKNWIDVYESRDNGKTWSFLHKIADTDTGLRNGNPPSIFRLKNGRIGVVYGYRGVPYSIRARVSDDNGKTWSREILLRDGARNWDIGYTRTVVRPDQKVVTLYYFTREKPFENHIVSAIWDPMDVTIN